MAEFNTDNLDDYKKAVEFEQQFQEKIESDQEPREPRVRYCHFCDEKIDIKNKEYEIAPTKLSGTRAVLSGDFEVICTTCYGKMKRAF